MFVALISFVLAQEPSVEEAPATEPAAEVVAPETVPAEASAPAATEPVAPAAPEVAVPETVEDAVEQGKGALTAFEKGEIALGIVLLLGVLLFIAKKLTPKK